MLARFNQEKSDLEEELAATCRDRDDSLMFAENEKQQVLTVNPTHIYSTILSHKL